MTKSPVHDKIHTYAILGPDGNEDIPKYQSVMIIKQVQRINHLAKSTPPEVFERYENLLLKKKSSDLLALRVKDQNLIDNPRSEQISPNHLATRYTKHLPPQPSSNQSRAKLSNFLSPQSVRENLLSPTKVPDVQKILQHFNEKLKVTKPKVKSVQGSSFSAQNDQFIYDRHLDWLKKIQQRVVNQQQIKQQEQFLKCPFKPLLVDKNRSISRKANCTPIQTRSIKNQHQDSFSNCQSSQQSKTKVRRDNKENSYVKIFNQMKVTKQKN